MGTLRRFVPVLAALALALLCAVPYASASVRTMGSDLKGDANVVEAHGADSAFWNVSLESGGVTTAPVGGQVTAVRIKGTVLQDPAHRIVPRTMIHFQSLHPMGDGSMKVLLSSAPFYVPLGGDPNTVSTYVPVNMCLNKGDVLDFNDIGGNEWHWGPYSGMPFQTFSAVRGSSVSFYSKNNGTNIGSRWSPAWTHQGEELLMQMKFASGPDATDICPGGYRQHVFQGLVMRTVDVSAGSISVRTSCPGPTYGGCKGTVRAESTVNGQTVVLGSAGFNVPASYSRSVVIPLSAKRAKAITRSGAAKVKLVAVAHDDPAHDSRTYEWRVFQRTADDVTPVQHKTTTRGLTLKRAALRIR